MKSPHVLAFGVFLIAAVALLAVRAAGSSTDAEPPADLAAVGSAAAPDDECPAVPGDYMPKFAYAEGVTREMVAESERLRAEMLAAVAPARPDAARAPTPEQQLADACADWRAQRELHHRRLLGEPEPVFSVPKPTEASCRRYCSLLLACTAQDAADAQRVCQASCARGDFGPGHTVDQAVELGSCENI
jgi:hypothetical protein